MIGKGYTYRPGSKKNLYLHTGLGKLPLDILIEDDKEGNFNLPDPKNIRQKISGVWYLTLNKLIEFKFESNRPQDIQDILQLIKNNDLKKSFATKLKEQYKNKFINLFGER